MGRVRGTSGNFFAADSLPVKIDVTIEASRRRSE
jgi:hypothetical protein